MKKVLVPWKLFCALPVIAIWSGCDTRSGPEVSSVAKPNEKVDEKIQELSKDEPGKLDIQIPPKDVKVPGLDKEIEKYRAMQVKPEDLGYKPANKGIETGLVVFFGHILPPPYELEFDEEKGTFSANGIEICPGEKLKELNEKFFKKILTPEEQKKREERVRNFQESLRPYLEKKREIAKEWSKVFEQELASRGVRVRGEYAETADWEKVKEAARATAEIIKKDERVEKIYVGEKNYAIKCREKGMIIHGHYDNYVYKTVALEDLSPEQHAMLRKEELKNQRLDCKMMYGSWKDCLNSKNKCVELVIGDGGISFDYNDVSKVLNVLRRNDINIHQKKILLDTEVKKLGLRLGNKERVMLILLSAE